jgi:ceramide glucosyltransferase
VSPLPAALAAALAAPLAGFPAGAAFFVTLAVWFFAETAFAAVMGWEISVWSPLAFLGREVLALAAWLRAWTTHEVTWATQRFDARRGPAPGAEPGVPRRGQG